MPNLKNYLVYRLHRLLKWEDQDLLAMQQLAPLAKTYLPWSVSSMRPSGLVKVLNDVVVHQRKFIVECGGGVSTYFLVSLLKERGGRLLTLEHNRQWCDVIGSFLREQGLADVVTIVHAPLAPSTHRFEANGNDWYDEAIVAAALGNEKVDLLLVDGPPAYERKIRYARYPAVPFFKPFLAERYTIVLDDVVRKGEREILARWEAELGIRFALHLIDGHVGIGHSKLDWVV